MTNSPTDAISGLLFPRAATDRSAARPTETECQVISLFEHFRDSLLRYALSFGLTVHDGEEITQEVFLALFRHLQLQGNPGKTYRGWIFRVAHNLALKRRYANHRSHRRDRTRPDDRGKAA